MSCNGTSKDRDTCQVEKFGCAYCVHNKDEEIQQLAEERDYYWNKYLEVKKENKELKQKLSLGKKVLSVEQTILKLIQEGQGSYENIAKVIYGEELNYCSYNAIRATVSRLRKKGYYNIENVENWGYKEVTNDR